jgi:hypothetical protein
MNICCISYQYGMDDSGQLGLAGALQGQGMSGTDNCRRHWLGAGSQHQQTARALHLALTQKTLHAFPVVTGPGSTKI